MLTKNKFICTIDSTDEEWCEFLEGNTHGSIFAETSFLKCLRNNYKRYLFKNKNNQILAGCVVIYEGKKIYKAPIPFIPHQGIIFSEYVNSQKNYKKNNLKLELVSFIIETLEHDYDNFSMSMNINFRDLRPFQWKNINSEDGKKFSFEIKYTGILNLKEFVKENYISSIRTSRRQEFNKCKFNVTESENVELFIQLYKATFLRQGINVDDASIDSIRSIIKNCLTQKIGRMTVYESSSETASMMFFIHDINCAYYLFGVNNPKFRDLTSSTKLMIENIKYYSKLGLSYIDFVGVNSPNRGDYKLSFNPELRDYYVVNKD
jgi:lipid II:glycine glycyltransferase (peptidoglycan interpeptide bridge formation enzyme)